MKNARRWNADGVQPGAPTSIDILLRCLQTAGNYKCWSSYKSAVSKTIVDELKAHGITRRTHGSVMVKVDRLRCQYEDATNWLLQKGELELYRQGKGSQFVKAEVLQRCPKYHELTPVFENITINSDAEQNEGEVGTNSIRPDQEAASLHTNDENGPGEVIKDEGKRTSSALEVAQQDSKLSKKAKRLTRSSKSMVVAHTGVQQKPGHTTSWQGNAECDAHTGETSKQELQDRLHAFEIENRQAVAKCHLEGEQKREEVRTNCEVLLARHKLLSAGVSKDAIDRTLTL